MEQIDVETWEEFLKELEFVRSQCRNSATYVQNRPLLFRGQGNSCWRLESTLERVKPQMLYREYYRTIAKIRPQIESLMSSDWPMPSYPEVERLASSYDEFSLALWSGDIPAYAYMAYLRHHGFPSPLLDWSRSPYVAAYFAFANSRQIQDGRVAIFILCERQNKPSGNSMKVLYGFGPYVKTHRRHVLQQSQYTICLNFDTEWQFENYDSVFDAGGHQQASGWKFTIPITERTKVLGLLDEQNLNAFSLFGSEESLMETLANREL